MEVRDGLLRAPNRELEAERLAHAETIKMYQKRLEELSAQHHQALSVAQEQHSTRQATVVGEQRLETEQWRQRFAELLESTQRDHEAAMQNEAASFMSGVGQAQVAAREAATAAAGRERTQHAAQVAALREQMEEVRGGAARQFKEAMEVQTGMQAVLKQQHAAAIASLTEQFKAERSSHKATQRQFEAATSAAEAAIEGAARQRELLHADELEAVKTAHQARAWLEVEQLKQSHAELLKSAQREHAAAITAVQGEMDHARVAAREAARSERAQHAAQVVALHEQMEQAMAASDSQFKEAMEVVVDAASTLDAEQAAHAETVASINWVVTSAAAETAKEGAASATQGAQPTQCNPRSTPPPRRAYYPTVLRQPMPAPAEPTHAVLPRGNASTTSAWPSSSSSGSASLSSPVSTASVLSTPLSPRERSPRQPGRQLIPTGNRLDFA
jgi:hypothetical protein